MRSKRAKLSIGGVVLSSHIGDGWPPRPQSSGVLALRCRYLSHPRERPESIGYPFPACTFRLFPTLNRWQPGVASQRTQPWPCIWESLREGPGRGESEPENRTTGPWRLRQRQEFRNGSRQSWSDPGQSTEVATRPMTASRAPSALPSKAGVLVVSGGTHRVYGPE